MNRQIGVDLDAAGQIGPQGGHLLSYDHDGNRVSDTFFGNAVRFVPGTEGSYQNFEGGGYWVEGTPDSYEVVANQMVREDYAYDAMNRLSTVHRDGVELDKRAYDTTGRVIFTGPAQLPPGYAAALNSGVAQGKGIGLEYRVNFYDTNGRLRDQYVYNSDHSKLTSGVHYTDYDAAGNLLKYRVDIPDDASNQYTYTHKAMEGYKEAQIHGTSDKYEDGYTLNTFDINGNLTRVRDITRATNSRSFVNDVQGHALYVNQNGAVQRQVVVNGEVLGRYGLGVNELDPRNDNGDPQFAQIADFNVGYQPINGNYPTAAAGTYQVQAGDTLRSIARQAYGDEGLWYRIAEGNGLSGERDLHVGQTLNIPSIVGAVHNRHDTFKPYDPSKITGDTTPNLPVPASEKGCGGLGTLLVVIVAVAVTYFTAGAAASYFGVAMSQVSAGSVAIGAASAAAGSVASQGVAIGLGMQEDFDWQQVGMAAIGGGMGMATQAMSTGFTQGGLADTMTRAAMSNAMTQGVGVMLGMRDSFRWRDVAASAAGAGVGRAVGPVFGDAFGNTPLGNFGTRFATGLLSGTAAAAMRGGKVTVQQVATDAFGNALGQGLVDEVTSGGGSGWTAYQEGDIGRSELRMGQPYEPDFETIDAFAQAFGDGSVAQRDSSDDLLLAAGDGFSVGSLGQKEPDRFRTENLARMRSLLDGASDPGSVEYYRQPDGTVRIELSGLVDAPAQDDFRRFEIEQMNATGQDFQAVTDQRVAAGTYDRFSEIGSAWSAGRYGEVWRHMTFAASPSTRAAVVSRMYPQPSLEAQRLDRMLSSPIGTTASLAVRALG